MNSESEAGFSWSQSPPVRVHPSALVKSMFKKKKNVLLNMAWPFLEDPIDEEAALLCKDLQRCDKIILRLQKGGLSFFL